MAHGGEIGGRHSAATRRRASRMKAAERRRTAVAVEAGQHDLAAGASRPIRAVEQAGVAAHVADAAVVAPVVARGSMTS
jgi:hypothetical protein